MSGASSASSPALGADGQPVLSSVDVFRFAEQARQAKALNEAYLQAYPALKRLLFDVVRACVAARPADAVGFACEYVRRYDEREEDRGQVPRDEGITAPGYVRGAAGAAGVEAGASLMLGEESDEEGDDGDGDGDGKRR